MQRKKQWVTACVALAALALLAAPPTEAAAVDINKAEGVETALTIETTAAPDIDIKMIPALNVANVANKNRAETALNWTQAVILNRTQAAAAGIQLAVPNEAARIGATVISLDETTGDSVGLQAVIAANQGVKSAIYKKA